MFRFLLFILLVFVFWGCSSETGSDSGGKFKPLLSFSASGAINGENIGDYSFRGTCLEDGEVTFSVSGPDKDGTPVEPVTGAITCEQGEWEITPSDLAIPFDLASFGDGEVVISVSVSGFKAELKIVKDLVPPTVLAPTSADPAIASSEWSWECQDDGCVDYRIAFNGDPSFAFPDDAEFVEATSSAPQGSNNGGDYYLHVQGRDAAGNLSNIIRSGPFAFDNVTPRLSQVVVSSNDNPNTAYAKAGNQLVFEATFDLSVTVDSSGGIPQLVLSVGGTPVRATFSGSSGTSGTTHNFSYTVEDNLNGTVRVQGLYLAGGTILDAGDSDPLSLEEIDLEMAGLTVDTTVPVVESIANDDAAKSWSWGCSEENCQYRILIDSNTSTSTVTGTYGVSATALAPGVKGSYYIHIQAQDPAGNESQVAHSDTALEVATTTADNIDPTVSQVTGTEDSKPNGPIIRDCWGSNTCATITPQLRHISCS